MRSSAKSDHFSRSAGQTSYRGRRGVITSAAFIWPDAFNAASAASVVEVLPRPGASSRPAALFVTMRSAAWSW